MRGKPLSPRRAGTDGLCEDTGRELMAMPPDLHIEVLHKEITVTMPGTSYTVTYYKPKGSRLLLAKQQSNTDDQRATVTLSEFLGSAWWAATERARELGWIV